MESLRSGLGDELLNGEILYAHTEAEILIADCVALTQLTAGPAQ